VIKQFGAAELDLFMSALHAAVVCVIDPFGSAELDFS
jgi:hypothetical protein